MGIFGMFNKKKEEEDEKEEYVSYDDKVKYKVVEPSVVKPSNTSKLASKQEELTKDIKKLELENKEREKVSMLKTQVRDLKRKKASYSPVGRFLGGVKKTAIEGAPRLKKSFGGIKKGMGNLRSGIESNLNLGYVSEFSGNYFDGNKPKQVKQPKTLTVKVGKNRYMKVKNPKYSKAPPQEEAYNPFNI